MRIAIRFLTVLVLASAACAIEGTEGVSKTPYTPPPGTPPYVPPVVQASRRVVILHTNDEHSHLLGFAPTGEFPFVPEPDGSITASTINNIAVKIATQADQQTVGGLVRRQYLINSIRATATDPVLLLSGGDVMMGTVTHLATTDASPDYLAMALLGYDFITLGNHEFDWGPDALAQAIVTVNNTAFGGAVPLLASNIHFDDVQAGGSGSGLQSLYGPAHSGAPLTPYAVKVLANGLKVGLLGLVGYDAALVAPGKSPISFSTPRTGAACVGACPSQCGNGRIDGFEQCDGALLGGATCVSGGYTGGTLVCGSNCTFDYTNCTGTGPTCGDGSITGEEQCDGANLNGQSCADAGFDGGTLLCSSSTCTFDAARCTTLNQCIRGTCVHPLDVNGHVGAIAAETQAVVNTLRDTEQVDVVIALTHLGQAEDAALASLTTGLDVIIGGHSHDEVHTNGQFPLMQIPWAGGGGQAIIVQAGSYGRKLGQLVVTVAPNGTVGYDLADSELIPVDYTVDQQIFLGTDLLASPPILSPAFERALNVTGGVIGPVVGGINAFIGPMLSGLNVLSPVAVSSYDIVGEVPFQDSNLLHLVTDAQRAIVMQGACLQHDPPAGQYVVAVQANGVIRESLRFSANNNTTTLADVFQVLPLGASPLDDPALPGYPIVLFRILGAHLYAGADVGVTNGLQADSFFLSYAGMRVSYNRNFPPFDTATFNPGSTAPQGRVTKMEVSDGAGGWQTLYEYDAGTPWALQWTNFDPFADTVVIITNLYLAGFLEAFGITPLNHETGAPFTPITALGGMEVLGQLITCQIAAQPNCGGGSPSIARCIVASGGQVPWQLIEIKEWATLLTYLTSPAALNGQIPAGLYASPVVPRVIDATP